MIRIRDLVKACGEFVSRRWQDLFANRIPMWRKSEMNSKKEGRIDGWGQRWRWNRCMYGQERRGNRKRDDRFGDVCQAGCRGVDVLNEMNTIRLLDFLSLPHDTHLSRPAGLQVSARRIQLTSVGVFLLGRVA